MAHLKITLRRLKKIRKIAGLTILLIVAVLVSSTYGLVWIWDSTNLEWAATLTDGAPIDTTNAENAIDPQVAIDANGITYVVFRQDDTVGTNIGRIYLSRYERSGQVRIWDNDTQTWTTTLADGDPIDTGLIGLSAQTPQLSIDSNGRVYVVFAQSDGIRDRIYISRYNGTNMQIYAGAGIWSTNFSAGSPIDANTGSPAGMPQLAIDSTDQVYVTFYQSNGLENHIYLSRSNGIEIRIWDNTTSNWTTNFANGDPIDTTLAREADSPQLAIDSLNNVYVTYRQNDGAFFNVYLSRFSIANGIQIWNTDFPSGWTTIPTNGDPVGLSGASGNALGPDLAIDSNDQVYIVYAQQDTGIDRVFLSRFNGTDIQIWGDPWTTNLALAKPIDTGNTQADSPQVIVDSSDNIYVVYGQLVGGISRIHLSRWNGTNVQIWDTGIPEWTVTLSDGDPIDAATGQAALATEMTLDTFDRVYIAFHQIDGLATQVFLSRYDDTAVPSSPAVEIWDQTAQAWTTTFTDGDPIDAGTGGSALFPQLAANAWDEVYISYYQNNGSENHIFFNVSENLGTPPTPPSGGGGSSSGGSCFLSSMGFGGLF